MRNHPREAAAILATYRYSDDLPVAERRHALLKRHRHDSTALENADARGQIEEAGADGLQILSGDGGSGAGLRRQRP